MSSEKKTDLGILQKELEDAAEAFAAADRAEFAARNAASTARNRLDTAKRALKAAAEAVLGKKLDA